jgi:hypothetical protein
MYNTKKDSKHQVTTNPKGLTEGVKSIISKHTVSNLYLKIYGPVNIANGHNSGKRKRGSW